jgi:hypothetical protein
MAGKGRGKVLWLGRGKVLFFRILPGTDPVETGWVTVAHRISEGR